jgi:hypothetical protein
MPDPTNDFLEKLDSGELDGNVTPEMQKLSQEQLEELARIIIERQRKQQSR